MNPRSSFVGVKNPGAATVFLLAFASLSVSLPMPAPALIVSVGSGDTLMGSHALNLIANGSFENGVWTPGFSGAATPSPSHVLTGLGTTLGPTQVPTGWNTLGGTDNYGVWGNDSLSTIPGPGLRGSAALPDGALGIYMGNQSTFVTPAPSFAANGVITFANPPTFGPHVPPVGFSPPFQIEQTVNGLTVGGNYLLDFWVSGEDADTGFFGAPGLLQLDITGEPPVFLGVPYSPQDPMLGSSQRYYVQFQAAVSSVTFTFINHGHLLGATMSTEAVLDDVILNALSPAGIIPEGSSSLVGAGTIGLIAFGVGLRHRRSSRADR